MTKGQSVFVEHYGDVATSQTEQVEIKRYQDSLTDSHVNFWKTLSNWMQDGFDQSKYSSLILQTTQDYGADSRLRTWNDSSVADRLKILADIHSEGEARERNRKPQSLDKTRVVPESLRFQRGVLHPSKAAKLRDVVGRVVIAANSPDLEPLYELMRQRHCKGILTAKQPDYLNALIGFVMSPGVVSDPRWEITYDQFTAKVKELTSRYCRDTREFPAKYILSTKSPDPHDVARCKDRAFVKKIHDIDYAEVVSEAILHYLAASKTVLEEFRSYEVPDQALALYAQDILAAFIPRYRAAKLKVTHIVNDSKAFYNETIAAPSPQLSGFSNTPITFRNGVLHMQFDDENNELKWRLE
jgi:hypothetical protein